MQLDKVSREHNSLTRPHGIRDWSPFNNYWLTRGRDKPRVPNPHPGQPVMQAGKASKPRTLTIYTFPIAAAVTEFVFLASVNFGIAVLYHTLMFQHLERPDLYGMASAAVTGLFVIQCSLARDHSIKRLLDLKEQFRSVFYRWNSSYSLFVVTLFLLQAPQLYSRGTIVTQYTIGLLAVILARMAIARIADYGLRKGLISGRRAVVIGTASATRELVERIRQDGPGAEIVETIIIALNAKAADVRPNCSATEAAIANALHRVERMARQTPLDEVVIALPWWEQDVIRALMDGLTAIPAAIHLASDQEVIWLHDAVPAHVGRTRTLRLARAPLTVKDQMLKRLFDVVAASAAFIALMPLLAVIAIAIKLDSPGPVLFRQRRHGFSQREFRVFKFRTMTTLDDGHVIKQARRNDCRVTRVGRFLRRTNLDELPQLLNVIRGDMSLVGPRPHAIAHNHEFEERIRLYARRHKVKPGITGWAQVSGYRGETRTLELMIRRVEHDFYYIDHWSVWFDIRILFMTLFSPGSYRNAY